jgi:uncharacterized membrane protein YbhN (UPF0104 family)
MPFRHEGRRARVIIGWLIAAGLTAGMAGVLRAEWSHLSTLHTLLSIRLGVAGILILINLAGSAMFAAEVLPAFGLRLRPWEWFCLGMASTLGNYVSPLRGGAGLRGGYLWARYGLGVGQFATAMAGLVVVVLWVASATAAGGLAAAYVQRHFVNPALWSIVGACLIGSSLLCAAPPRLAIPANRWLARAVNVLNGWRVVARHPRLLARLIAVSLFNRLTETVAFLLIFQSMGVAVDFWAVLTVTSLGMLTGLVSITPGALGIYEAGIVLVGRAYGLSIGDAILASLVVRLLALAWLSLLGPLGSAVLATSLRNHARPAVAVA